MIYVCSTIHVQLYSTDVQDAPSVTEDADSGDGEAEAAAELVRLVPICFCFWSAQINKYDRFALAFASMVVTFFPCFLLARQ